MKNILIFPAGTSETCRFAAGFLNEEGIPIVDHPTPEITHVLLDVPTDIQSARETLRMVPVNAAVFGGNLPEDITRNHKAVDFLKQEHYLCANAAITADCAIRLIGPLLKTSFSDAPALVIGWGRIGKCLARLLRALGCPVTLAVRKETDSAALRSLGYKAVYMKELPPLLPRFRQIFNTAPESVLTAEQLSVCCNSVKIDLASRPGLASEDVIHARGLPGKYAPESAGRLIAHTLLHYIKEDN